MSLRQRYVAHTMDGSPVFGASTAQEIGDRVIDHMRADRKPAIGYVYDRKGRKFPFTVWRLNRDGGCVAAEGIQCADFTEVCNEWRKG